MIIFTRRLAKRLKTVFRQALNLTGRSNTPTIQLQAGADGVRVRCSNGRAAAEYHLAGEQPEQTIYIPLELLSDMESGREIPVEINTHDGMVTATWQDSSGSKMAERQAPTVLSVNWPPLADNFTENPADLLTALRDAAQTTDAGSTRYALGCIQFHGGRGNLVATDGRQALVQGGFDFPWEYDLLIPANKVFTSKQLPDDEAMFVGRADDWALFRIGPWTFWQRIETEARFPHVASQIRKPKDAQATCMLQADDRTFLLEKLVSLPGADGDYAPVTVDLNGSVAVRGRGSDETPSTELILSASTRTGDQIRFNTDRRYLRRAAELGLNRLHVFDDKSPVQACDQRRQYIWAVLEPGSAIAPQKNAIRIESAPSNRGSTNQPLPRTRRKSVTTKSKDRVNGKTARNSDESEPLDPITAAETLRDSLRHSLQSTTALVRILKQHRKRNKAVESTLLSLRQLQAIDA